MDEDKQEEQPAKTLEELQARVKAQNYPPLNWESNLSDAERYSTLHPVKSLGESE